MKNFLTRANDQDFGMSFFDTAFDDFFRPAFFGRSEMMRTDVKNTDRGYEISVDMPGYDKKDISVEFDKGYLTISAKRESKETEKDSYVKRERCFSCSRSYYVGDNVTENDIKAKYENGVLTLSVPKPKDKPLPTRRIEID